MVEDDRALERLLREASDARAVAIDCEQNGLYAYQARVCLVQLSTAARDWIIDPLTELRMERLAPLLADPGVVKVFHAAEEDVIGLWRDFGLEVRNLFDTMWAAKMLGWPRVGLAPILLERHGVTLDKRLQRHDWGKRPLDAAAVAYAQLDTHFLIGLYRDQERELASRGRLEDAREVFAELAESRPVVVEPEPWALRIKGERDLDGRGRAIAHALADAREKQAKRLDRPPFKVIGDRELLALAIARPSTPEDVRAVEGISARLLDRNARWLASAVRRGLAAEPPPRPPKRPRDDAAARRYEAMRRWRNAEAARHGVPGEVIVPNDALKVIARRDPRTLGELKGAGVLGPRRLAAHGEGLLAVLAEVDGGVSAKKRGR